MKKLIILILILFSFTCHAGDYLTVNLFSKHFDNDENLNEQNFGIGVNTENWILGFYENSHRKTSTYIGYELKENIIGNLYIGIQGGLISGYTDEQTDSTSIGNLHAFILPEVIINHNIFNQFVRYKIGFITAGMGAVTFQIDIKF